MTSTVIGLYDDMRSAQATVRELRDMGIANERIGLIANDTSGEYAGQMGDGGRKGSQMADDDSGAETGAGIGAVMGGLGGLLVGLGALTIPGIGPVLAAGPLAAAVSGLVGAGVGAVAGAAAGGLLGALVDMGIPEEQAGIYAEGVRRGGTLVTVETEDRDLDRVRDVMNRHDPVDIDERASQWRSSGWQGFDANAQPYQADQSMARREGSTRQVNTGEEVRMPVVEEELKVGKRQVERGGVRVHSRVTEQPVEENINLRQERVSVERRPVDRPVSSGDMDAFKEGTVEVTEMGEEAVVEKRARVAEEVVVRKDVEETPETVRDTVRRSDVEVENTGGRMRGQAGDMTGMSDRSSAYRGHYQTNFANSGYQYEHYEPAYLYGSQLRDYEGYQGWEWDRVEPEARQAWEQRNPGTWERIRDAVRYGWDSMRDTARDDMNMGNRQTRR
jgi:uncharacterized protein (TIGR02271 family)